MSEKIFTLNRFKYLYRSFFFILVVIAMGYYSGLWLRIGCGLIILAICLRTNVLFNTIFSGVEAIETGLILVKKNEERIKIDYQDITIIRIESLRIKIFKEDKVMYTLPAISDELLAFLKDLNNKGIIKLIHDQSGIFNSKKSEL